MESVQLASMDGVFCKQDGFFDHLAVCRIDASEDLYLVNDETLTARRLPDAYQKTPIVLYRHCGGYRHGLIMVSRMGGVELRYQHNFYDCAGMWGWIDTEFVTVIEPQYVYAENFFHGRANVCKGEWTVDEGNRYWCERERWGVIDLSGAEIVPCRYDELRSVDNTDRLFLVHKGGWKDGCYCVYDAEAEEEILDLDFDFDCGYMFNSCFMMGDDLLVFTDHIPGGGKDLIYVYDLSAGAYLCHARAYTERTLNGQRKVVVHRGGRDIIVF